MAAGNILPAEVGAAHQELIQQLLRPEAYPHPVERVSLVQTHISSLFFAGDYVYKVKRPVNYGFVDYTTLGKRRYYCRRETTLNRRLAPEVYLGVVEVRRKEGRLVIAEGPNPGDQVVDFAVKMRRLPSDSSLASLLGQNAVSAADVRRIGQLIARFHEGVRTCPSTARIGGLATVQRNVRENFRQTRRYLGAALGPDLYDDIVAYSTAFLEAWSGLFEGRAALGRVREGHGDLKASDIYLAGGQMIVLDCVEFNRRFRCADVVADIAFLAMDLDYHGRPDLSRAFVEAYMDASGEAAVEDLLVFYKCYRAYVRAKVNSFRLDETGLGSEARDEALKTATAYYHLAASYARSAFPRPALILVAGLMGTGKTTIATELARRWGAVHVSTDVTRKALAGIASAEHQYEEYGGGIYRPAMSQRTYAAMLSEAREALALGSTVLLDGTYRAAEERRKAVQAAAEVGASTWIVECAAPEGVIRRRVLRRQREGAAASDARWELYPRQRAEWEPVVEAPPRQHLVLDTSGPLERTVQRLLRQLYGRALGAEPA